MSDLIRKTSACEVKSAGERRATAVAIADFNVPDLDLDAYAFDAFNGGPSGYPMFRAHAWDTVPFAVATKHSDGRRLTFDIEYLATPRGDEEYATARALHARGIRQAVSIGFRALETAPVPEPLKALGAKRFIKRAELIELSFVLRGAVPGAELVSIKAGTARAAPTAAEVAAVVAESQRILAEAKHLAPSETPEKTTAKVKAGLSALQDQFGPWLPAEVRVDPGLHRGTVAHVAWAADVLGIVPPTVKWFSAASVQGERYGGFYDEGSYSIYLRDNLRGFELASVCNHEVLHANRGARGLPQDEEAVRLETERLNTAYAKEVLYGRQL